MKRITSTRLGVAAATIVAGLALAACGTQTIDGSELEGQLVDQLAPDLGADPADAEASCPDDIEAETGREFECTLTVPDDGEVRVEVTLTDDEGGFRAVVPREQFE